MSCYKNGVSEQAGCGCVGFACFYRLLLSAPSHFLWVAMGQREVVRSTLVKSRFSELWSGLESGSRKELFLKTKSMWTLTQALSYLLRWQKLKRTIKLLSWSKLKIKLKLKLLLLNWTLKLMNWSKLKRKLKLNLLLLVSWARSSWKKLKSASEKSSVWSLLRKKWWRIKRR